MMRITKHQNAMSKKEKDAKTIFILSSTIDFSVLIFFNFGKAVHILNLSVFISPLVSRTFLFEIKFFLIQSINDQKQRYLPHSY